MNGKIINRSIGGLSCFEQVKVINQQFIVEGKGMVIVDFFAFGHTKVGLIIVVIIL
ncbi:hypothetical protein D3C80_2053930 [compost metagenome]